jgi:hypothetical protein
MQFGPDVELWLPCGCICPAVATIRRATKFEGLSIKEYLQSRKSPARSRIRGMKREADPWFIAEGR